MWIGKGCCGVLRHVLSSLTEIPCASKKLIWQVVPVRHYSIEAAIWPEAPLKGSSFSCCMLRAAGWTHTATLRYIKRPSGDGGEAPSGGGGKGGGERGEG